MEFVNAACKNISNLVACGKSSDFSQLLCPFKTKMLRFLDAEVKF